MSVPGLLGALLASFFRSRPRGRMKMWCCNRLMPSASLPIHLICPPAPLLLLLSISPCFLAILLVIIPLSQIDATPPASVVGGSLGDFLATDAPHL